MATQCTVHTTTLWSSSQLADARSQSGSLISSFGRDQKVAIMLSNEVAGRLSTHTDAVAPLKVPAFGRWCVCTCSKQCLHALGYLEEEQRRPHVRCWESNSWYNMLDW